MKASVQQNTKPVSTKAKRQYQLISQENRLELLDKIFSKKLTIKQAARECGIVFSTAKVILKTYKKEGRVGKKQHRIKKIKTTEDGIFNQTVIDINKKSTYQTKLNQENNSFLILKKVICKFKKIDSNLDTKYSNYHCNLQEVKDSGIQNILVTRVNSNLEQTDTVALSSQTVSPKRSFIPYTKQQPTFNLLSCARVINLLPGRFNQNV